jgi:AraC-like DNA-binding protein
MPDELHEVDAWGIKILIAFVEAESELGAALLNRQAQPIAAVDSAEVATWRANLGDPATLDAAHVERRLRLDLLRERQLAPLHPRVKRVLRFLRAEVGNQDSHSLERLAAVAGLSTSRLMHVFTQSVGVAFRPYNPLVARPARAR